MKSLISTCAIWLVAAGVAMAAQADTVQGIKPHDRAYETPGHDPIGNPISGGTIDRTIAVNIEETPSGYMLFEPDAIRIESGSVVRFVINNSGALDHEFMLGSFAEIEKHQQWMRKFPDMEHQEENSVTIRSGDTEELVWEFSDVTNMEFVCLIPGHREAGMWGVIMVHHHLAPESKD